MLGADAYPTTFGSHLDGPKYRTAPLPLREIRHVSAADIVFRGLVHRFGRSRSTCCSVVKLALQFGI
jgi:hypothetical protein